MVVAWDGKWERTPNALCVLLSRKQYDSFQWVGVRGWGEDGGVRSEAVKSRLIYSGSTGSEARLAGEQRLHRGRSLPSSLFILCLSLVCACRHVCTICGWANVRHGVCSGGQKSTLVS